MTVGNDPVASRYAQAIFEAATAEQSLDETLDDLRVIRQVMLDTPEVSEFLLNPDVDPDGKIDALDRATQGAWGGFTRAFLELVIGMGRVAILPAIVDALQALVDDTQGRLRVTVRAARPIPEDARERLRKTLEAREHKQITVEMEIDPSLLGGVEVHVGHRLIDGSVRRQLAELKQQLKSVRVH